MKTFIRFLKNENGATAIEYGLITALVSVAIIGSLRSVGQELANVFTTINNVFG